MMWNLTAECVAFLFALIILVYSSLGMLLPTLKNRIFRGCLIVTLCAILSNILSTLSLQSSAAVPLLLTRAVTFIYFIFTPLIGLFFCYYTIVMLYEYETLSRQRRLLLLATLPSAAYFVLLAANPWIHWIYSIRDNGEYVHGPLIACTYLVFYSYCVICVFLAFLRRKQTEATVRRILMCFPVIAVIVILIQQALPSYILTGVASVCSLLIVYLFLQNKQLSIDPLTNLSNRPELVRTMRLWVRDKRAFTLLVLSLNEFKLINDKVGNDTGDLLLQAVAGWLREVVGFSRVYRYGGDQFAIVLSGKELGDAEQLAHRLLARFQQPWVAANYPLMLRASVGLASYPDPATTMDELTSGMERALESARRSGCICTCTPKMLEQVGRRKLVEQIMKDALAQNGFEVFIQPIYAPTQERFMLAESLLRLNKTPLGPIYPDEFIPVAEDSGLIIDITYWVLEQVCAVAASWLREKRAFHGIAVNLSPVQFLQEDFSERIVEIIAKSGVPFKKIKFEITESTLISNFETVKTFLMDMNQRGCRFGLDDFGTGYSNMSSVLTLPFDTIKFDKSLVWTAVTDARFAALIRYMTGAFQALHIDVLAEGVENEMHDEFIRDCGCDFIQGFYYARPMPAVQAAPYFTAAQTAEI